MLCVSRNGTNSGFSKVRPYRFVRNRVYAVSSSTDLVEEAVEIYMENTAAPLFK